MLRIAVFGLLMVTCGCRSATEIVVSDLDYEIAKIAWKMKSFNNCLQTLAEIPRSADGSLKTSRAEETSSCEVPQVVKHHIDKVTAEFQVVRSLSGAIDVEVPVIPVGASSSTELEKSTTLTVEIDLKMLPPADVLERFLKNNFNKSVKEITLADGEFVSSRDAPELLNPTR